MPRFQVEQTATGVLLWEGVATSEQDALDLMAKDAGYENFANIPDEIGGADTIAVTEIYLPEV